MSSWFTLTPGDHSSKWLRPLPLAIANVSSSTLGAWSSGSKRLPEVKGHLLPELPYSKRPYPVPGIIGKNEIFHFVSIPPNTLLKISKVFNDIILTSNVPFLDLSV